MEDIPRIVELWYEMQKMHEAMGPYFILKSKADCDLLFSDYLEDAVEHSAENRIIVYETPENELVGYCHATLVSRPPVYAIDTVLAIDSIAVTETHRRRGIGRVLCQDVFDFADRHKQSRRRAARSCCAPLSAAITAPSSLTSWC